MSRARDVPIVWLAGIRTASVHDGDDLRDFRAASRGNPEGAKRLLCKVRVVALRRSQARLSAPLPRFHCHQPLSRLSTFFRLLPTFLTAFFTAARDVLVLRAS